MGSPAWLGVARVPGESLTMDEVSTWHPYLFLAWVAFCVVGAWVTATIKARSDEYRHGLSNWLIWFGGLTGVGVAVGVAYVALAGFVQVLSSLWERMSAWLPA